MPQTTRSSLTKWARWGLLAIMLAMGASLMSTAWFSQRRTDEASQVLAIGQAEALLRALGAEARERGEMTTADLAEYVHENRQFGVRYVEIFSGQGGVTRAGSPIAPLAPNIADFRGPFRTAQIGDRIRIVSHAPFLLPRALRPPPDGPPSDGGQRVLSPPPNLVDPASASAPPPDFGPPPNFARQPVGAREFASARSHLPYMVLEFEPVVGNRLRDDARWTFILACAVTLAFLLVTAGLWHLLGLREQTEARAEQEHRLTMLGEMSAVLAHEIRNPLASLKGHAQLLEEQLAGDPPRQRKAERVVVEAKRIEELSQALLDFVRSGAIEPRNVNPKDLITQCSHSIDARIAIDASRAPPSWPLDGFRMRQVFTNLLENAAQASGKDQPIEVRIAVEKGRLVVTIRDRGKGIASAETERIFEAFHTTRTQGVGLGLAIARRIVELHGGSIDAGNHEQGGAIFTVRLPKGASA